MSSCYNSFIIQNKGLGLHLSKVKCQKGKSGGKERNNFAHTCTVSLE